MEDVTDTVFRQIIARHAPPDVFFTEFVNVDGMCSPGREAVIHRLRYTAIERPIVAQVWGLKPENFEHAARDIREMGFDGVDLNMGCSVKKVLKTGACARLIENPGLADEIIRAAREGAGGMPVSVKTRIGYGAVKTEEWCGFLLGHNIAALTVHGRTAKQTYSIPADWREIAKVVTLRDQMRADTAIIGNGDIANVARNNAICDKYGVDGVMIGRGILHDPFAFGKPGTENFSGLSAGEKAVLLREHLVLYKETWEEEKTVHVMKKFVRTYISNFKGATQIRTQLMAADTYEDMLKSLSAITERR